VIQRFVLEDTALTYIPLILPLASDSKEQARELLYEIARVARPREVLLALNEALSTIQEDAEGFFGIFGQGSGEYDDDELYNEMDHKTIQERLDVVMSCFPLGESVNRLRLQAHIWQSFRDYLIPNPLLRFSRFLTP